MSNLLKKIRKLSKNKQYIKSVTSPNPAAIREHLLMLELDDSLIVTSSAWGNGWGLNRGVSTPELSSASIRPVQMQSAILRVINMLNTQGTSELVTTYCTNNKNCKYQLLAPVALRGISGKYRRNIKFDGGSP